MSSSQRAFSTEMSSELESSYHEYDPQSAPQVDISKIHAIPPLIAYHDSDKYVDPDTTSQSKEETVDSNKRRRPLKRWLIAGASVLVVIAIIAAVVGGVVGSRQRESNSRTAGEPSTTSVSTAQPTDTPQILGSGDGNTVNDAWAYNGTSLASLSFSTTTDTSGTNYVVFYQHSNGDIRKAVYNNSQWHASEFVTNDAYPGTGLASYFKADDSSIRFSIFYYDRSQILQELRGRHGSSDWLNGTIGQLNIRSSEILSLTNVYNGLCQGSPANAWVIYHTGSQDEAGVIYWNEDTDVWAEGDSFKNVKPAVGFAGHTNIGVWRYYYVNNQSSQLNELACPDCCSNSSTQGWRQGLHGPVLDKSFGSIAAANVGLPRMLYYLDPNGSIRELNNSGQYPHETWIENVSSDPSSGNTGDSVDPSLSIGPPGTVVFDASAKSTITGVEKGLHRGVSMSSGFRGKIQQIWLFYQVNGTDVTVQTRDSDSVGIWSQPTQIPVGR